MFGRHPRLALDVAFGVKFADMGSVNTDKYVDKLQNYPKWAYKVTCETNLKEIKRHKRIYVKDIIYSKLGPGDLAQLRQKGFIGKHNIHDRWENAHM